MQSNRKHKDSQQNYVTPTIWESHNKYDESSGYNDLRGSTTRNDFFYLTTKLALISPSDRKKHFIRSMFCLRRKNKLR